MQYKIFAFFSFMLCANLQAQNKNAESVKYDVVVSFGSMCCGTASDDFLKEYIKNYNYKNKDTVNGWLMGGCGREGDRGRSQAGRCLLHQGTGADSGRDGRCEDRQVRPAGRLSGGLPGVPGAGS